MINMKDKEKIIKISKICKIVSKVFYIVDCVITFVLFALAIILPITNAIPSISKAECAIIFSVLTLYAFFLIDFFWNTTKFFNTIYTQQSVFGVSITKSIQRIAISTFILSTIPALIGSILIHAIVPNSEFVFRFEIVGISAAVVLYFIGLFFNYGAKLQKQDDETL